MRILVIVSSIGRSAAGIVAEEIFSHLIEQNPETHIICNQNFSKKIPGDKVTELGLSPIHHNRKDKFLMMTTHKEWNGRDWVKKGLKEFKKLKEQIKPDVVLSFISAYGFRVLELGYRISKECKIPLAIHAVDPLPSTPAWGEHPLLRRAIISIIKPYYQHASFISATNEAMLSYQLRTLKINRKTKYIEVIPNPTQPFDDSFVRPKDENSFIYLGSLYGKRNPENLIQAFIRFSKNNPDARLYFVGKNNFKEKAVFLKQSDKILFKDWTDNPMKYVSLANVLVDIDADIKGDVFMSSKLTNYLNYNKIVLAITPLGSPCRRLLEKLPNTSVVSSHRIEDIEASLKKSLEISKLVIDFSEREEIKKYFSASVIATRFIDCFKNSRGLL